MQNSWEVKHFQYFDHKSEKVYASLISWWSFLALILNLISQIDCRDCEIKPHTHTHTHKV